MNRGQFKAGNKGKFKALAWLFDGLCIRCTSHAPNSKGYPQWARFKNGKTQVIMRSIMLRRHGAQPAGIVCRHTCDNRWCIHPDHIIPGTVADNNRDARERGRWGNMYVKRMAAQ